MFLFPIFLLFAIQWVHKSAKDSRASNMFYEKLYRGHYVLLKAVVTKVNLIY